MKLIVGIDFGTSTTVVRYKKEGTDNIYHVKDADGVHDTIASAIFRSSDQPLSLYGHEAINAQNAGMEGELITNFKMGLLDASEDEQKKKRIYIKEFLSFVYQRFALQTQGLQYDEMDVFVSYPAKWSDSFITFMKNSVVEAGFDGNVYGINEPKAASYNLLHKHLEHFQKGKMLTPNKPMNVFMLDMGAGTTDIVIFQLCIDINGNIEINNLLSYPSLDNPCLCGGREIDQMLVDHILSYVQSKTGYSYEDLYEAFPIYSAKTWKDTFLSPHLKNGEILPMPNALKPIFKYSQNGIEAFNSFSISKSSFESATEKHWWNLYKLIESAIGLYNQEYNIGAEKIDFLYLTGGHSQWYTVENLFNGEGVCGYIGKDYKKGQNIIHALNFDKLRKDSWRIFSDSLPHECVATGLCMQDQKIKMTEASANNIWIKISINEFSSECFNVVKYGETIPLASPREIVFEQAFKKNAVFGDTDFHVTIDLYTGQELETANHKRLVLDESDGGVFNRLIAALFLVLIFLPAEWIFKVAVKLDMCKDGTLSLDGLLDIDKGRKTKEFNLTNFSEL